jgi:transposase
MNKKTSSPHPQWATKHREQGTELRLLKGKYYLYQYKTIYDKEKKKPKKITGSLLGTITERDGFKPSSKRILEKTLKQTVFSDIRCKEYGMSIIVKQFFKGYCNKLQLSFPDVWKEIIAIAYCRFLYRCPLKNIPFRLSSSFLPELLGFDSFSEKRSSQILKYIGSQQEKRISYMKSFIKKGNHILMDLTNVKSYSQQISLARTGYSSDLQFEPQFNLMYLYDSLNRMPAYYRLIPGNIREVKAFKNTLIEAGLNKAIIIADKGFYSMENVKLLKNEKLQFILPLRRDNSIVPYDNLIDNSFKEGENYFEHEKRPIWYRCYKAENDMLLFLFLDEKLRTKEESDYLIRIKTYPEEYNINEYHKIRNRFGTLALLTNIKKDHSENIYTSYKSRNNIEVMFDGMKNILEADHTYMQDEQTLQGWMFINHITLQWYQHLYIELKEKDLLKKFSVNDYIQLLTDVKKIKINNQWHLNEYTSQTQKLIEKVGVKIT